MTLVPYPNVNMKNQYIGKRQGLAVLTSFGRPKEWNIRLFANITSRHMVLYK